MYQIWHRHEDNQAYVHNSLTRGLEVKECSKGCAPLIETDMLIDCKIIGLFILFYFYLCNYIFSTYQPSNQTEKFCIRHF